MTELKKSSVKSKVEAVLFSAGNKISLDEISRLCRSRREDVIAALQELKKEYEDKQSSLMLVEEGDFWKFTVKDHFMPIVRKIVTETELTKSMLETLAVIAFKYPILQSDLIKIRTNKAYDHLTELEVAGYISRQKHSRTNLIKLTEKFFKYFDLTEEKLKDQFKDFDSIAKAIKEKEEEVEQIKEEQHKKAEELKQQDEKIKNEIESLDELEEEFEIPLQAYEAKPKAKIEEKSIFDKEKLGQLEIVNERQESNKEATRESRYVETKSVEEKTEGNTQLQIQNQEEAKHIGDNLQKNTVKTQERSEGIKVTPEMEVKINKRIEELLHPEKEDKKEKKTD